MRSPLGMSILFSIDLFSPQKQNDLSDVSLENYATRDGRKAIDNVDDEAERELKKVNYHLLSSINQLSSFRKYMSSMVLNDNFINKFNLRLIKLHDLMKLNNNSFV
jgi:hypothetical protein